VPKVRDKRRRFGPLVDMLPGIGSHRCSVTKPFKLTALAFNSEPLAVYGSFDACVRAYIDRRVGIFKAKAVRSAARDLMKDVEVPLRELWQSYAIWPIAVLEVLVILKANRLIREYLSDLEARIRSQKLRERDSKNLSYCANLLEMWNPYLSGIPGWNESFPEVITTAAKRIGHCAPANHRPSEIEISAAALALASIFRQQTGKTLYRHIARLLHCAFGEWWHPAGDPMLAAKHLVKRMERRCFRPEKIYVGSTYVSDTFEPIDPKKPVRSMFETRSGPVLVTFLDFAPTEPLTILWTNWPPGDLIKNTGWHATAPD
jgi:hypothetical protein